MKVFYIVAVFINFMFAQELNLYLQTKDDGNQKQIELDIEIIKESISGTYQYKNSKNSIKEIKGVRRANIYLIDEFDKDGNKSAIIKLTKINPFTFKGSRVELKSSKEDNLTLFKDIFIQNDIGEEYEKYLLTFVDTNSSKIVAFPLIENNSHLKKIGNFFLDKLGFNYSKIDKIYKLKYYNIEKNEYEFESDKPENFNIISEEILDVDLINANIISYCLIVNDKISKKTTKEFASLELKTLEEFDLKSVLVENYKEIIQTYIDNYNKEKNTTSEFKDYNSSKEVIFSNHEIMIKSNENKIYIPYYEILDINNSFLKISFAFDK